MPISSFAYISIIFFNIFLFKKFGGSFFNFIPTSLVFLILLLTATIYFVKKIKVIIIDKKLVVIFLWFFLMYISLLWTNSFNYGLEKIITFLLTIIIFYLLSPILYKYFKFFIIMLVFIYILYILNLYTSYGTINELSGLLRKNFRLGWDEDASTLFHPIGIARFISFGFINIYFLYILLEKKINRLLLLSLCGILVIWGLMYLFFSGTKTPIVGTFVAIAAYILLNKHVHKRIKFIILTVPVIVILGLNSVIYFDLGLSKDQKTYIEYRFFDKGAAFSDRAYQNERALNKVDESNIILGSGSGNFSYLYNKNGKVDYPHNIISEVLIENGIFTVISLILLLYFIIKININNKDIPLQYFIIIFYFFYFNALFSGDMISNNLLYGFSITVIMYNKIKEKIWI